jgi:hypothetical protein
MKHCASVQSIAGHLAVLLLCLGSGCVRSIQPVLKDSQVIADDRLLGSWVSSDGKTFGRVTPADDRKSYNLLVTGGDGKQADMVFRLGRIGDMTLADFTIQDPMPDASDIYKAHLLLLHSFLLIKQVVPNLAQLPQITPENNFSRGIIGDGAEPVRAEHAKADVV